MVTPVQPCKYVDVDANDCECHALQQRAGIASHYITCPVVTRAELSGGCYCPLCTGWIDYNAQQGPLRTT